MVIVLKANDPNEGWHSWNSEIVNDLAQNYKQECISVTCDVLIWIIPETVIHQNESTPVVLVADTPVENVIIHKIL